MKSVRKSGARALAVVLCHAALALLVLAPAPCAQAAGNFWEEGDAKPSVTGRARKSYARKAHIPREDASNNDEAPARKKKRHVRVASRGDNDYGPRPSRRSITGGGGLSWAAPRGCLNGTLVGLVQEVASSYGPVTVSSTCRDKGHNASVGGAPRSQHLTGDAVDFRVHGNVSGAIAFLRHNGSVGGFHHYGGGLFHIDTGPKRTW